MGSSSLKFFVVFTSGIGIMIYVFLNTSGFPVRNISLKNYHMSPAMQLSKCFINHQGNLSGPEAIFLVVTSTKITSFSDNEPYALSFISET